MGIGIGGDYPLSAVISSEFASTRSRGRLMTAVFANQGWGQLGKSLARALSLQCAHAGAPQPAQSSRTSSLLPTRMTS